ncbi:hunchback [Ptiloglossa arizonensis]|uniref:hunchback n=1 Tax=Ptiloglossa arizonensis TaxID=3350558 RepID=UPI003FA09A83
MRGNWDTAEPLVHAPNQQRQQQQQTIVEEQRHPLHSPTTPAWGIADRIVKEESNEDKNNDSGVSPDHYTSNSVSPRSRRSSSTANCSLSPGSATSQDSNNMQCSTFDYSPQRIFKNCGGLPLDYARHHSMDDHRTEQAMNVVSSTVKPSSEDVELGQDVLQCPICAFTSMNSYCNWDLKGLCVDTVFSLCNWDLKVKIVLDLPWTQFSHYAIGILFDIMHKTSYKTHLYKTNRRLTSIYIPTLVDCLPISSSSLPWRRMRKRVCEWEPWGNRKLIKIPVRKGNIEVDIFVTFRDNNLEHFIRHTLCTRLSLYIGFFPYRINVPRGTSTITFTEHLGTHCATKCEMPDFAKTMLSQLTSSGSLQDENRSSPTQGERSEHESEEADEPGVRVPRVNSQGKVKTFRCKQCNFVAITKLEFWEHSRGHIKAEKLLTCPKCPFVTEYKHHLEYHLRNHFGSKPFKCDKCSYSCVNKSMLNSHLKSHSNVYQYRCANCSYATKYCHSLKLHLRKYSHQPAMVLNADGSPNPLPIIDVYGTRRGPKQKSYTKMDDEVVQQNTTVTTNNNNNNNTLQTPLSSPQIIAPPQVSPVSHLIANPLNGLNSVTQTPSMMTFPYSQIFSGFPLTASQFTDDTIAVENHVNQIKATALLDYVKTIDGERIKHEFTQDVTVRCFDPSNVVTGDFAKSTETTTGLSGRDQCPETKAIPLDLSKPETAPNQGRPVTNSPRATGTSRRKGKAVKLERRVLEEDTDDELEQRQEEPEEFEPPAASSPGSRDEKCANPVGYGVGNEFICQYCEIAFGNVVMYTVHMGYHGFKDPYTCNMCGHQCTDKVSFFLHIARSKHS